MVRFHENGRTNEGILSEDTSFIVEGQDIKFKAGTRIRLHENGQLQRGVLLGNASFIISDQEIIFKADTELGVYENGHILSGTLAVDTTIGNESYTAGTVRLFNRNGQLSSAEDLSRDNPY
jgi:hypothetical protein